MGIDLWSLVRFVHVVGAIVWVGGQLTLTLVVMPAVRANVSSDVRPALTRNMGMRFGIIANVIVLPLQLATGFALAFHRGVTMDLFAQSGYSGILGLKIILAFVAVGLAAVHGIAASRKNTDVARAFGLGALGTSLVVVMLATALVP